MMNNKVIRLEIFKSSTIFGEEISFDFGGSLSRPFFHKMVDLDDRIKHMDASGWT